MALDLDPRFTFDSYVVGSANRLAAAAARRVAETPGTAYNPLFLYSASGLGKTHLLTSLGHHVRRLHPELGVTYDTLQNVAESVVDDIEAGERDALRWRLRDVSVLLLDDVQFLTGRHGVQEELLRVWDGLSARGGQIVLASDRPPTEIDGLDHRLLSRFSGGLIVDLSAPDYETRVAIVLKKAEERGQALSSGVAETLARIAISNVRELQGRLNRVLAIQELDARTVEAAEVSRLLGVAEAPPATDEFATFLQEIAGTVGAAVARASPVQKLADAIARFGTAGLRTTALEAELRNGAAVEDIDALLDRFNVAAERLAQVVGRIRELDPGAGELARLDVLRNPQRVAEAEALLEQVQHRMRPLPAPPAGPRFSELSLDPELLAVRAARAAALQPGERYNPLFVHAPESTDRTSLATALALQFQEHQPRAPVAFMTGDEFAAELIGAISSNGVDSWRARYRRVRLLVIDGVDALMDTERAQEELFHFFDMARRSGVQLVFTASRAPAELDGLEERLRSRLGSGLVVDLLPAATADRLKPGMQAPGTLADSALLDTWFTNREKVLWRWPYLQDCITQEQE
jgi:chromosomal replication initiation ATPase DnaA